jgi:tetratricopeptide (TPR) repeat protein
MLQTAFEALSRRDAAAALAAALAATKAEPDNAEAHYALGLAQQLAGQLDAAAAALDRAIALDPERAQLHLARASLALTQRDLEGVDRALGSAVRQDPNTLGAYILAAFVALGRGQLDEAERQHRLAARVNAEHPLARCVEGNLALARGDHQTAQKLLNAALQQAPNETLLLSSLALAYLAGGNHAFAEQALRRALELQPDAVNLRRILIDSLQRQSRREELVPEFEAMLTYAPDDWLAAVRLGELRLVAGDRDGALDAFARMLSSPQLTAAGISAMAQLLLDAGMATQAQALVDAQLERSPTRELLWQGRMALASDAEGLSRSVERWLEALPDSELALQTRATLREQSGDFVGAVADADAALARNEALAGALMIKLRSELMNDPAALLGRVETQLARVPTERGRHMLRMFQGLACDRLGRHAEAVEAWRAAGSEVPPGAPTAGDPAAIDDAGSPPRLLWGAPGSRVRELVILLRGATLVLEDRFSPRPRPDGLGPLRQDGRMATAAEWAAVLREGGVDPETALDWLPYYDGRVASQLPDARLLAVIDDPRDLLLNWMAFGAPQGMAPAPEVAATWLAARLQGVASRSEAGDAAICRIDSADLLHDPDTAAARVQAFLGLGDALPIERLLQARTGIGGLPTAFEPGHWRAYAEPLAAAFARLQPLAMQLGYPAG